MKAEDEKNLKKIRDELSVLKTEQDRLASLALKAREDEKAA